MRDQANTSDPDEEMNSDKEYPGSRPFFDHLGIERVRNGERRALLALQIKPEHRNQSEGSV